MNIKLMTEHHLEFLSLKEGCTSSSESPLVKMPRCWKSRVMAHMHFQYIRGLINKIRLIKSPDIFFFVIYNSGI